jgi:transposase-like protein
MGPRGDEEMPRRARRNHSPAFKAKVALEAVRGVKTAGELAQQYDIHPNLISDWKTQLLERAASVFGDVEGPSAKPGPDLKELHAKIGRQALEIDFLEGALGKTAGPSARR